MYNVYAKVYVRVEKVYIRVYQDVNTLEYTKCTLESVPSVRYCTMCTLKVYVRVEKVYIRVYQVYQVYVNVQCVR